jgi:hypothetical protein
MIGLADAAICGLVGGSGGNMIGLADAAMCGTVGGSGGNMIGLADAVMCGTVGGSGGNIIGLATALTANATVAAARMKPRILTDLEVITLHSLGGESTAHTKSNPKGSLVLPQK